MRASLGGCGRHDQLKMMQRINWVDISGISLAGIVFIYPLSMQVMWVCLKKREHFKLWLVFGFPSK